MTALTFSIRTEEELCRMNTAAGWKETDGTYCPIVSRFTPQELYSGLPFHTENEPVRFAHGGRSRSKMAAELYAVRWMTKFNRWLERGFFRATQTD